MGCLQGGVSGSFRAGLVRAIIKVKCVVKVRWRGEYERMRGVGVKSEVTLFCAVVAMKTVATIIVMFCFFASQCVGRLCSSCLVRGTCLATRGR